MSVPQYCMKIEGIFPPPDGIKAGEVGIEVEVEGENLLEKLPSYWEVHKENSLRGESKEYALKRPLLRKSVLPVLKYLKKKLDAKGSHIYDSQRTGVHVHINCQGLPLRQVYNFICLYLLFEDLLVEYAGETRVGNVFCLRAKDAEYFVDQLVDAVQRDDYHAFHAEHNMRYSSVNVCALWKFNSLEFRALRGTIDPDVIAEWTSFLLAIKDASQGYDNPRGIVEDFSRLGPREFLKKVFPGPLAERLEVPGGVEQVLWGAVRLVQEIAYAVNWRVDKPQTPRRFGPKKYPQPAVDLADIQPAVHVRVRPGIPFRPFGEMNE